MTLIILLIISIIFIVVSTTKLNLHAFLALLTVAIFYGLFSGMELPELIAAIQDGFGGTIGKIGIVIIAGTIIGTFLEKSGGAFAMAESILKFIGEKRVPLAMSIVGYFVSIPVFADSGFVPYGEKSMDEIAKRTMQIAKLLVEEQGVKALVVACNTATAAAIKQLRERYTIPVIGMEPGIKPAIASSESGVIGVLATPATLNSSKYSNLKDRHGHQAQVIEQPCPGLAARIEAGHTDDAETESMLREFLRPLLDAGADTLVLGCTHYPMVRPLIEKIAGNGVVVIDTAPAIARELERQLSIGSK